MGHPHIRRMRWLLPVALALAAVCVVDAEAGQTCRSNELPLSWNRTGPPGPPGGSVSFANSYSEHVSVPPGQFRFVDAVCPAGTTVIGGGYATENVSTALLVPTSTYPIGMPDGRGAWYVVTIGAQAESYWRSRTAPACRRRHAVADGHRAARPAADAVSRRP